MRVSLRLKLLTLLSSWALEQELLCRFCFLQGSTFFTLLASEFGSQHPLHIFLHQKGHHPQCMSAWRKSLCELWRCRQKVLTNGELKQLTQARKMGSNAYTYREVHRSRWTLKSNHTAEKILLFTFPISRSSDLFSTPKELEPKKGNWTGAAGNSIANKYLDSFEYHDLLWFFL